MKFKRRIFTSVITAAACFTLGACSGIDEIHYTAPDTVVQDRPYTVDPGFDPDIDNRETPRNKRFMRMHEDEWRRYNN